jgi:hypothetical protein
MGNRTPAVPESCVPGTETLHTAMASDKPAIQLSRAVCAVAALNISTVRQIITKYFFIILGVPVGMQIYKTLSLLLQPINPKYETSPLSVCHRMSYSLLMQEQEQPKSVYIGPGQGTGCHPGKAFSCHNT